MSLFRSDVLDWFDAGRVAPGRELEVLRVAGIVPAGPHWHGFLAGLSLWLGTIALAASAIFFFAFNWDDLGRLAKFALVEAAILAGLLACWRLDLDSIAGKAALMLLSLLAGALLALTGQIYQTGADTFQLFALWAALILPWVLVSRFSPLWLLWLGLLNLAVYLYFQRSWDGEALLWTLFVLDSLVLIAWEAAHRAGLEWLRDSWPPRLVAIGSGTMATGLMVWAIMGAVDAGSAALAVLAYLAWAAALYFWYRHRRPDLFMLAGGLLSLIVIVVAFLTQNMPGVGSGGLLFVGLVVIGMSAGGAIWLRSVAREQLA